MKGASSNSETPAAIPNAERAGIEPWRYLVECLGGFQRQWHGPERSRLLAVELHLPVRVDVADVNHSTVAVDVAALERKPLLRAKSREPDEHGQRPEDGEEAQRRPLRSRPPSQTVSRSTP